MSDEDEPRVYRIIGPHNNRLLTVHPSATHGMGQVDHATAELLKTKGGWKRYIGSAQEDNGWIVPGSDPALKSRTTLRID
jgi:hypothetical protein